MDQPEVKYARSGDLSIAYQVLGNGPIDLVFVPFSLSAIFSSPHPPFSTFYERLASFSRLILFDKRGIGASDRPRTPPTLEAQMDDVRAVLDAVGSEQAALLGAGHGAQMCALFAATYPERTSALVLYAPWPGQYPGTPEDHRRMLRRIQEETGRAEATKRMAREQYPSVADDEEFVQAYTSIVRASVSPGAMVEFMRTVVEADVSDVLSTIRVPTLVLYRKEMPTGEQAMDRGMADGREIEAAAKAVAAEIPDAHAIGIAGMDYAPFVGDEVADEVERFLSAPLAESIPDRVLATILFTDIVGSTEWAASLGDSRWRDVLASHRADVRRELARFAGNELDTAGDGFFASFDGPARGIACAETIVRSAAQDGLEIRAGLHTGECEREGDKLAGIAVHIGARIAALAGPGEVLVSRTVKDLVAGSGVEFDDRGEHELKGVQGAWQLYAVKTSG